MPSSRAAAPQSSPAPRPLPVARTNPHRLRPLGATAQARAALLRLGHSAVSAVKSMCGAGVVLLEGTLSRARRACERVLWWLGYAKVDLVGAPKAAPRPLPPPKTHPRLIRRDFQRPIPPPRDDDEVTNVYVGDADADDDAKTSVCLARLTTEDEVTRVVPDNVIPIHRAR